MVEIAVAGSVFTCVLCLSFKGALRYWLVTQRRAAVCAGDRVFDGMDRGILCPSFAIHKHATPLADGPSRIVGLQSLFTLCTREYACVPVLVQILT